MQIYHFLPEISRPFGRNGDMGMNISKPYTKLYPDWGKFAFEKETQRQNVKL